MMKMLERCFRPSTTYKDAVPIPPQPEPEPKPEPIMFSLEEMQIATLGWHSDFVLGIGRTYTVFKGILKNKEMVAIKRLRKDQTVDQQLFIEYKAEKSILLHLHHENIIQLKGFSIEMDELILVLELAPKGTLYDRLHDTKELLGWENRMKIALGVARAMSYIHEIVPIPLVHRDIKTTHILIDENYNAKLIDFKNAIHEPKNLHLSHVVGSVPYVPREYRYENTLSTKCDIYAFGVVLLELLTGRKPTPQGELKITSWVSERLTAKGNWDTNVPGMIDERIFHTVPPNDMYKMMELAVDCMHHYFDCRPKASKVVKRLLKISCLQHTK